MAIINCKICGGEIEITPGLTTGECPYCGTMTTFPRLDVEGIEEQYRYAEEARLSGNYDKAIATYEEILRRDVSDPDAYWGLVLSTWGIEYVEDPLTKERKPTCHRVQFESILEDENFRKTLELSGSGEAEIYKKEASKISEIQKTILKISAQEKPFDIFICYKERDDSGMRTADSVFAQELYDSLCERGYKVFFARVTLADKVGLYEPYIFSALNSAKVMLVIGSKKEYIEASWVKNEWSRFLFLMRKQPDKILVLCHKGMNSNDIPWELSMFQAQDMNKKGFAQDLIRGLGKVLGNYSLEQNSSNSSRANHKTITKYLSFLFIICFFFIGAGVWLYSRKVNNSNNPANTFDNKFLASNVPEYKVLNLSGVSLKMIKIKAGRFQMGSPEGELGREKNEKQHWVTLTQDYWLGETEVTQEQWMAIMGTNPSKNAGVRHLQEPVDRVSWKDVMLFCDKLNSLLNKECPQGFKFSLPSEAQWEYACRARTTTAMNNGKNLTNTNWYGGEEKHSVAIYSPNNWGLYDMHGNVWELCNDYLADYDVDAIDPQRKNGQKIIIRGGSCMVAPKFCRSAYRGGIEPLQRCNYVGFRLALVPIRK